MINSKRRSCLVTSFLVLNINETIVRIFKESYFKNDFNINHDFIIPKYQFTPILFVNLSSVTELFN